MKSPDRRSALVFFFAWFLECLSSTILISVTVNFAQNEFGADGVMRGMIISVMASSHLLGNIFVGRLSDKFDRRLVISLVFLFNAIFACFFGLAPSLTWLIVARAFAGLLGTTPPLAFSLMTSLAPNISLVAAIGTIHSVAFIVGPLLALGLQKAFGISPASDYITRRLYFFVAGGLSFLSSLVVFFGVPKKTSSAPHLSPSPAATTPTTPLPASKSPAASSLATLLALWKCGLGYLWLARLFASWAQVTVTSTLSALATEISATDAMTVITVCNAVGGATCALAQSLLYTALEPRLGTYRVMSVSLGVMAASFGFYFLVMQGVAGCVYAGHGLLWVGAGLFDLCMPTINRKKLEISNKDYFGLLNGVVMSFRSVSQILCPLIANVLISDHKFLLYFSGLLAATLALVCGLAAQRKTLAPIEI